MSPAFVINITHCLLAENCEINNHILTTIHKTNVYIMLKQTAASITFCITYNDATFSALNLIMIPRLVYKLFCLERLSLFPLQHDSISGNLMMSNFQSN